jgi:NAD(P)-dependent dehydrogenase (short-subunit alcohol dehydrogenase family)
MSSLSGKVAIVTGGSKGIGFAVAVALLRASARVLICGRNTADLESARERLAGLRDADLGQVGASGARAAVMTAVCDVRDEAAARGLFDKCVKEFGGVDILVNNAGVGVFGKTVEETTPEEFRAVLETNLFGVYYACHFAIPLMRQRGGGYIVNISSLAGQNAHPRMAAYNASKFALNGFTEALMQEVRHDNIRVSLVCPGSVNTEFGGEEITEEKIWQLQPADVAQVVIDLLSHDPRSLPSKVEIRPSKPPKK